MAMTFKEEVMETTFENALIGDHVWSIQYGWGVVEDILLGVQYPIKVNFPMLATSYSFFSPAGRTTPDTAQTLFWDELILPERPRHKVKKQVGIWLNIYKGGKVSPYLTESQADLKAVGIRVACVKAIAHYEIEE
jgi:hypothetical protein